MLQVENLQVKYNDFTAIKDVSLHVGHGEVVGILGPNGAGKTTLLKALIGVIPSAAGSVRFLDEEVAQKRCELRVRSGMALVPEGRLPIERMTVYENLMMPAAAMGKSRAEWNDLLEYVYSLFPSLKRRANKPAGVLSGGEQQMLAIGRALVLQPKLLLLDEPMAGLAPKIREEIYSVIKKLAADGNVSIVLVDQAVHHVMDIASRAYVLKDGAIQLSGSTDEMTIDQLRTLYLN